jgi:UDP-hydrolysing UDP-N-acetyl-D-glucosamine 2-epimerase
MTLRYGGTSVLKPNQTLEVVVTARPSWARVKTLVDSYISQLGTQGCRISLVGPAISDRYGHLTSIIDSKLKVSEFPTLQESDDLDSVAITSLNGGLSLARSWRQSRPDAVLIIADRTETLGVAVCASLMQIPLIHLQGGETTGSIDDKVRKANSKLADFHLTTNENTRQALLKDGEDPELIRVIGCPSIDLVKQIQDNDQVPIRLNELGGVGAEIDIKEPYGIIMFHPDTANEQENVYWINGIIEMIKISDLNWFWFWPNPDHGTNSISKLIRRNRESGHLPRTRFIINLPPEIFIKLALESKILVGNSSFGIREASFIGLPVLNLGRRQFGREKSLNVIDFPEAHNSRSLWDSALPLVGTRFDGTEIYGKGNSGKLGARAIIDWMPITKLK